MSQTPDRFEVLVLAGGPDAEREVSLQSAAAVARALEASGRCDVRYEEVDRLDAPKLKELCSASDDEIVFPMLHGPWGEGGGVQRLLEELGRPFVGTGSRGSAAAMDKVRTKQIAAQLGIRVLETSVLDPEVYHEAPFAYPVIVKPVCQGSSIGMRACLDPDDWALAIDDARSSAMPYMVEPMLVGARELAVGAVAIGSEPGLCAVPIVEITPAGEGGGRGLYDYEAKYERDDTRYSASPELPGGVGERVSAWTLSLAHALRVRHLCRADFLLDDDGRVALLELNTMPGFTSHSLLPLACRAGGVEMPALCVGLVERAWHDARQPASA